MRRHRREPPRPRAGRLPAWLLALAFALVLMPLAGPAPFSPALQRTLNRAVAELGRHGLALKVAIVATKIDLGAIPDLFGRPQTYARFLDQEISLNGPQPLLTVMPQGFGIVHAGPPGALAGVTIDAAHQSNGLARSAILAVMAIARARGERIDPGPIPSPTGAVGAGSGAGVMLIAAAAALALAALAGWRLRRRTRPTVRPAAARPPRQGP